MKFWQCQFHFGTPLKVSATFRQNEGCPFLSFLTTEFSQRTQRICGNIPKTWGELCDLCAFSVFSVVEKRSRRQKDIFMGKLKKILSDPNFLTLFRIAAAPAIVILLLFPTDKATIPNRIYTFSAALVFSAAAITDYLDGYFARTRGLVSNLGKMMDPLADKLLVSCSLIMLASLGWIPGWIVCIIIGREIAVTGLRGVIAEGGEDVSASVLGKYKTGFQIAAIIPLLLHYEYFGADFHVVGFVLLLCAMVLTVWSGADYFIRFRKLLTIGD